jgi:hypothetical protein
MKAFGYSVFTGIAVLLAMLIVSCNDNADSGPFFDEYGNPLVTVAIQAEDAQGRALTADVTEAIFNFFEVIVKDVARPDPYSRAAGSKGAHLFLNLRSGLNLTPAAGDPPKAVIFAGYRRRADPAYNNNLILLAIGVCTAVNGNTTDLTIRDNTSTITFTLVALENDIVAETGHPSDFQVTAPADYRTDNGNYHILASSAGMIPYFELPHNRDDITARLRIENLATNTLPWNPARSICLVRANSFNYGFNNTQFMWGGDPIKLGAEVDYTLCCDANDLLYPAQVVTGFPIKIDTRPQKPDIWQHGWALLALGIPVKIHADRNDFLTWFICTGMFHDRPDTGREELSLGGGILIRVGNPYHDPDF